MPLVHVLDISIHAPTRGATATSLDCLIIIAFQSTLPREERPTPYPLSFICFIFQSTLPREERRFMGFLPLFQCLFQSTLPREERPTFRGVGLVLCRISIHAPTRGATLFVREALELWTYFNPRSHERSDAVALLQTVQIGISIHAPTRGATLRFWFPFWLSNFNPRSHERSDSNIAQKICLFLYNTDNKYIIR